MYTLERPTQRDCAVAQRILTLCALGVLQHLAQAGLAYVQVRVAAQMIGSDFVGEVFRRHETPPAGRARPCWPTAARGPARCAAALQAPPARPGPSTRTVLARPSTR